MADPVVPAPPVRPSTLMVGTALATGAVVMFFAGLFAVYFSMRADTMAWEASGSRRAQSSFPPVA